MNENTKPETTPEGTPVELSLLARTIFLVPVCVAEKDGSISNANLVLTKEAGSETLFYRGLEFP